MSLDNKAASVVQQKKENNYSVNWWEYVSLCDHLSRQVGAESKKLQSNLAPTDAKVETIQQSLVTLQRFVEAMT